MRPHITASAAWITSFSHRNPGSYQLWLGSISSLFPSDVASGKTQNVLAWIIVGHHVPWVSNGGPALVDPGQTTVPQPPCFFAGTLEAINALTGHSLGFSAHEQR
jgi:hypothetical protein